MSLFGLDRQEGHIYSRVHYGEPAFVENLCLLVVVVAHLGAQVAGAGVNHHPQRSFGILLELDEVVASAKCAHLLSGRLILSGHHG